jgi:hypothetical protein
MDFVKREGSASGDPREQVKQILMTLHCEGYIFGNLRASKHSARPGWEGKTCRF